jgi:hypothetical protein
MTPEQLTALNPGDVVREDVGDTFRVGTVRRGPDLFATIRWVGGDVELLCRNSRAGRKRARAIEVVCPDCAGDGEGARSTMGAAVPCPTCCSDFPRPSPLGRDNGL